jgi:hypothetical protein
MLRKHFGTTGDSDSSEPAPGEAIPDSLRRFLANMSSFEGVEGGRSKASSASRASPRPHKTSRLDTEKDVSSLSAASNLSDKISFDVEQFNAALKNILGK